MKIARKIRYVKFHSTEYCDEHFIHHDDGFYYEKDDYLKDIWCGKMQNISDLTVCESFIEEEISRETHPEYFI